MADPNQNINETNARIRQTALETASIVEEALRSITESVADAFETALGNTSTVGQSLAKDLQKSFNTLGKTSKETASNLVALNNGLLKSKTVQEQINKRKAEELSAGISLAGVLKAQGAQLETIDDLVDTTTGGLKVQEAAYLALNDAQKNLVSQYAEGLRYSQEQTRELKRQEEQAKKIEEEREKSLGISGKVLKTLGGIKGLGDATARSQEKLNEYAEEYRKKNGEYPKQYQTLGKAIQLTGTSFVKGLLDPAVLLTGIAGALIKGFNRFDQAVVGVQKRLSLSREEAGGLVREFTTFNTLLSSADLLKSFGAIQDKLGSVGTVSRDTAETFARLNTYVGLSEEGAAGLAAQADAFGKKASDAYTTSVKTTAQISKQYKTTIDQRAVLESVGKASSYTLVQFRGSTQALTEGVAKAKALGISLETVSKSASGLLNFQQSIEDELAAELLTGKQLNLEQARYYALTNQQSKLMDELNGQIGTYSDFTAQTVLAQEAQAKALGMSVEDLSDMLFKQEYMKNTAQEQVTTEAEAIKQRIEQITLAEKLQKATDKVAETFANFVAGPLGTFLTDIRTISGIIGFIVGSQLTKMVAGFIPLIVQTATWVSTLVTGAGAITGIGAVLTGGAAVPLILGAIGSVLAVLAATKANDLFSAGGSGSGYGKRTLVAPEGAFALNDRDNIIATTNPVNPARPASAGTNNITVAPAALPPVYTRIELNGSAIGNATSKENYGVGKNIYAFGGRVDYSA
tara:strand:- start:8471 stop:10711 length:2241 start_codon:yes stop_codon:yes gene_type:complete